MAFCRETGFKRQKAVKDIHVISPIIIRKCAGVTKKKRSPDRNRNDKPIKNIVDFPVETYDEINYNPKI